jgi:hypothetical protein
MEVSKCESIREAKVLSVVTTPHAPEGGVQSVRNDQEDGGRVPMQRLANTFSKTYLQSYIHLKEATEDTHSFF